jgi:hypothetical protein
MVPVGESGALYRTQIVADGQLTVTINLVAHRGAGVRAVHWVSCSLRSDTGAGDEPTRRLMEAADKIAWTVLRGGNGVRPSSDASPTTHAEAQPVLSDHLPKARSASQHDHTVQGP